MVVAELSFFEALKGGGLIGYLIVLALVLIVVALAIGAFVYQRILSKRFTAASKATQENFETTAVNLRKRALGVKEHDDGQRKCELEAKERDELKCFSKFANTKKLRSELQRLQQQQRALKQSVSHVITLGLKDIQTRLLQAYVGPQPGRRPAAAPNHQNKSHAAARSVLPATQQRCPDHGRAS